MIVTPVVTQQRFTSFQVLASAIESYDLDIKQIDRGSFTTFMQQIQCGAVYISRFSTNRRVEVNGNPPPGVRTFGIPTARCHPFTWRGQRSDGNSIQIYKPLTELVLITNPGFEAIDVSISENDFNSIKGSDSLKSRLVGFRFTITTMSGGLHWAIQLLLYLLPKPITSQYPGLIRCFAYRFQCQFRNLGAKQLAISCLLVRIISAKSFVLSMGCKQVI